MPRFRKQVLAPQRFTVALRDERGEIKRDADGNPILVEREFTTQDVREIYHTQKAMLRSGLQVPVPLEHQLAAVPLSESEHSAGYNCGHVVDAELAADGSLWNTLEVNWLPEAKTDNEIAHRLKTAIKYVSPYVARRYTDGSSRTWNNAITHLCLTSRPVWYAQRPFGDDGAALSHADSAARPGLMPFGFALSIPFTPPNLERSKEMGDRSRDRRIVRQAGQIIDNFHSRWNAAARRPVGMSAAEQRIAHAAADAIRAQVDQENAGIELCRLAGFNSYAKAANRASVGVALSQYLPEEVEVPPPEVPFAVAMSGIPPDQLSPNRATLSHEQRREQIQAGDELCKLANLRRPA